MAAILELLLTKQVLPAEVVCWLTRKHDTPAVLQDLSNLRDEFVPYFVNLLRDDSLHLLQTTKSTNSTPAKTPLSVKLNKNNGVHRLDSSSEVATSGASRIQLFSSPDVNKIPVWKQSPGAVFESPQPLDSGGRSKGRNTPKPAQQRRRSSPYTDLTHTANGSLHKPDAHRSQHRHDLSAYFSAADLEQRLKHHQQLDAKGDPSPTSFSSRRPSNKKRRSYPSGDRRKSQTVNAETVAPVFNLVDSIAFPSLANNDHPPQGRTAASTNVPKNPVNASLPKGTKVITRSRRIATTIVTHTRKTEVTDNLFLNAPTVMKGPAEGAVTCWGNANPAKFVSLSLEKRLVGNLRRAPNWTDSQTDGVSSRNNCRTDADVVQISSEGTVQTLTAAKSEMCDGQPVSLLSGVTPTKSQLGRSVTEWVTADRSRVTHEDALRLMADVYSGCLHENLVPNLTVELYFVVQLLTARSAETPSRGPARDEEEVHHFDTVHNTVYFAVSVLSQQTCLLSMLDRGILRLLADNKNIANFSPDLRQHLNKLYRDSPAKPLPLTNRCLSPVGGVSFQADTDNRKNFPSDRVFHLFKKQRDLFYELIRDWQESHMTPGWNMLETQGEKIRHLVGYRTELANHIHFARLFQSQLIQMCTGERSLAGEHEAEEAEKVTLLSQLKQTNPDKFKRLQERFVMPSSLGLPCPPPSFPGWQEFFRDFVVAASSHVFNQHLLNTLATHVVQLNSMQFSSAGEDGRFDEAEEDSLSFIKCMSTLRLLGKYLGFVAFLPYQTPDLLPDCIQDTYVSMRNQSQQPVDVMCHMETALSTGRTVLTLPWVVEYLSMADVLAPRLAYYDQLFHRLLVIHRLASGWFQQHQSQNALLLLLILGWLFQLPVFPEELFFKDVPPTADIEFMVTGSLDATAKIDQSLISICCPYVGEVRVLLVDFAVGLHSCSHNIRKITPVLTESPALSTVSDLQLQQQLEESFFSNHPASLKRTVEFVADRIASNFIKRFRAHMFPTMLEAGHKWVKELIINATDDIHEKRTKEKILCRLEEYSGKLADDGHCHTRQEAKGYCSEKAAAILHTLLPEETPTPVLMVATSVVERISGVKISAWMTAHVTQSMLRTEFITALDKQLKTLKISRNTNFEHSAVAMMTPLDRASAPPGVCMERTSEHDEKYEAPADVVIRFKAMLSKLMMQTKPGINTETLCDTLQITRDMFNNRQDIIPGVYRALAKMSVDLAYVLVLRHPHMWQEDVERHLVTLWRTHLWEHSLFHNVVCPKHMYLIRESDDPKACWQKLTELALSLLRNDIVKPGQMDYGLLQVLQTLPTQEEVKDVTIYVCTLAEFFHALHHGNANEEFLGVLDMLHALCAECGLKRAHAAVQHCIDVINDIHSEVTGSSAAMFSTEGSSAGGINAGGSSAAVFSTEGSSAGGSIAGVFSAEGSSAGGNSHLGHDCTQKIEVNEINHHRNNHLGTDHQSNKVTETDNHCNKVTDTDNHCNKVTDTDNPYSTVSETDHSNKVPETGHPSHEASRSMTTHMECSPSSELARTECVPQGDCSSPDPQRIPVDTTNTSRTHNSCNVGSGNTISRQRISEDDHIDDADCQCRKTHRLQSDTRITSTSDVGFESVREGTTHKHNDTSRRGSSPTFEDRINSGDHDVSTAGPPTELEAIVHPVCT